MLEKLPILKQKQLPPPQIQRKAIAPINADPAKGLTKQQVLERTEAGWSAGMGVAPGKSEKEIIKEHCLTFFNLVFVVMALLLAISGSSILNMGFLMVAFINTVIGIIQQIRAKRAVDKLTLVAERPVIVIRDGVTREISPRELVVDDIAAFGAGDALPADGILRTGSLQVDESLLTGEADPVDKKPGDPLLSGSVVLSGHGRMQLKAVGPDAYASRLAAEAKANPTAKKSEMMRSLDKLIFYIGIGLIPVGLMLFIQSFFVLDKSFLETSESTVAALVGMIPEGLYLLTSIALAASALKLSRSKVLVQDMNCVEALARVDILCVDKTGTITEPTMEVHDLLPLAGTSHEELETILAALFTGYEPDNDTGRAMQQLYAQDSHWVCTRRIPFSSVHKWSGGIFKNHGAYLTGAPEYLLGSRFEEVRQQVEEWTGDGFRVMLVARYNGDPQPGKLDDALVEPLALVLLTSPLRKDARETFAYFQDQGVSIRVLSGDNPRTASLVAQRAGIPGAENFIDARELKTPEDYQNTARKVVVFGRVTPEQKKLIIAAMQSQGHTVAMTGDGVNDLLAMKQADCSVAMASGSQAATHMASMVLLNSDFAGMPHIVGEGRRVINNIQRSASLFLVKNIFSVVLSLVCLFSGFAYPLIPIQLTVVAALTIGIPSFFLALEPNYTRVKGKFLPSVLRQAMPGGLTNVILVVIALCFASMLNLTTQQIGTICASILGVVGLLVLLRVCQPFVKFRIALWFLMAAGLLLCFTVFGNYLQLGTGSKESNLVLVAMLAMAPTVFFALSWLFGRLDILWDNWKTRRKNRKNAKLLKDR